MSIKFIHTGDIHLGMSFANCSFGPKLGLKRRAEIKETFFKILKRCQENKVDLLLIAGDLFEDDFINISELKDVQKIFQNMEDVQIVISAGNHDPIMGTASSFQMMNWSKNVTIFPEEFSKISIDSLNLDIYSFSWNKKEIRSMDFEDLEIHDPAKNNILMLHGDIYTKSAYLPLNIYELLEKGFDYIALGHIHKAVINQKFAYCGSPEPLDFSETGEHGIIEGIIDQKQVDINFLPIAKRNFEITKILINPDMTFEEIKTTIVEKFSKKTNKEDMFRLIIEGMKDEDVIIDQQLLKEAIETKVYYCEILDQTKSNYNIESIKRNNQGNLIGEFILYMEARGLENPQIKDALYEGLKILLSEKVNG